jgi:ubiquinone biosynthesis protein COQ4
MSRAALSFPRLRTVVEATGAALADPTDTAQVFRIAEALSFDNPRRVLGRFRADPGGARLLAERGVILSILTDRQRLEGMPAGSLAAAYLDFLDSEQITADGLVAASEDGAAAQFTAGAGDDLAYVRRRLRDTHDLWHAVTGYRGDLLGEAALLAFTFAQIRHPGIGFLTALGLALGDGDARRMIAGGYRRGRRAVWLAPIDWEPLLPLPLAEARRRLRVEPAPAYEPVREIPPRPRPWNRSRVDPGSRSARSRGPGHWLDRGPGARPTSAARNPSPSCRR